MTSIINAASGGVTFTGGTTAELAIQAGGSTAAAFNTNGLFFRNRIINGDMRIDQRNAGASITLSTTVQYPVDRFPSYKGTAGATVTAQQSSTAPTGFTNSIVYTASTGATPAAGDINGFWQMLEGFNVADLGWGTANAQTVTLSFWVRSSVTGTYSVSFANSAANRFYVATYTVNSANTYEYKTITVAGDTSGTWLTNNGVGIQIVWDLGYGTNFNGTAGSWSGSTIRRTSGSVQLIATTGATLYITGVQLETGSTATPFERRPFGTELMLCQRYYEKSYQQSIKPGTVSNLGGVQFPVVTAIPNGYQVGQSVTFIVTKRAAPTVTNYSYNGNTSRLTYSGGTDAGAGSATPNLIGEYSFQTVNSSGADVAITAGALYFFTASAEL